MGETRVIYHLDEQQTPYLVKIGLPAEAVTLGLLKQVLNKPHCKFYFKAVDDDFGVVKEEISDDNAKLPCFNGRVISWLVSGDSCQSDAQAEAPPTPVLAPPPVERTGGLGESRPPSFHAHLVSSQENVVDWDAQAVPLRRERENEIARSGRSDGQNGHAPKGGAGPADSDSSSTLLSSQLETTSFCDSEEDSGERFSQSERSGSLRLVKRQRCRRRRTQGNTRMERSVSLSSVTDSTMSLNIITVMLNMEKYNFLGISIVGQSNDRGDGGIYIGSIMKGGAVASDERIQPGDMLLQVNEVSFEQMSNDEAVRVLREVVHKPGPITLTVAKCWDPQPRGCFTLPRSEPVRPIDPAAWVSHTAAMTACLTPHYSLQEESHLSIHSDMAAIAKTMADPESGLEVRDRMWLKITIPNAFIGSDVVDWLHHRVEGFSDRREARKYAGNLLKAGHIRHTVNKVTFSEQCYYIFGDICPDGLSSLVEAPLHQSPSPGCQLLTVFPYQFPVPHPYSPPPLPRPPPSLPGHGGETGSHNGEGGPTGGPTGSPSGGSHCSGPAGGAAGGDSASFRQEVSVPPPAALPSQDHHLSSPPPELTGSRQSFRIAVGNPSECFVDVM